MYALCTPKPAFSVACRHNHAVASRIVTTWRAWEVSCTFSMIPSFVVGFSRPAVPMVFCERHLKTTTRKPCFCDFESVWESCGVVAHPGRCSRARARRLRVIGEVRWPRAVFNPRLQASATCLGVVN